MPDEMLKIGDVVSFAPHPTVPRELDGKYFRVEAIQGTDGSVQAWKLSRPYNDHECTKPYHAIRTENWNTIEAEEHGDEWAV